jgi:hypothetical protein
MASRSSAGRERPARASGEHPGAANAHRGLALIFLAVAGVVQFFLAGLIAFGHGARSVHASIGDALTAAALLLLILAFIGRRSALQASAALFVLMIVQNVLGRAGTSTAILGALHPVNALLILGAAMLAAAGRPLSAGHGGGGRASARGR